MLTKEFKNPINLPENIFNKYYMNRIAFFDIETTGFDKEKDFVVLISFGYFHTEGYFHIKQYFAEDTNEESNILYAFGSDLMRFDTWCSYNGMAFDEPFINVRMQKNNIFFQSPEEHIDLYRLIRPFHKLLGMDRCNLKSVEKHIGIERRDKIDGGMSVDLYYSYLESKDETTKNIIMLHNYEDVLNLPKLFTILYEVESNAMIKRQDAITEKQLTYLNTLISKNNVSIKMSVEKISKKTASRLIAYFLNGSTDVREISNILSSNY